MPRQRRPPPLRAPLPRARLLPCRRNPAALPTHQVRSRDTRERLIAAVELVVRDVGLERATVRAIAARAGLSVGSVYRRFANKRALLLVTQERFLSRRATRTTLPLRLGRKHGPALDRRLRQFVNGALLAVERDRPMLSAFARQASSDGAIHAELSRLFSKLAPRSAAIHSLTIDVLLTLVRGLVLDAALPSGRVVSSSRHALGDLVSGLIGGWMVPSSATRSAPI